MGSKNKEIERLKEEIQTLTRRNDFFKKQNEEIKERFHVACDEREWLWKSIAIANEKADFWKNKYYDLLNGNSNE
ncbi:hypothetical protein [Microcystis phage Mel-JY01]